MAFTPFTEADQPTMAAFNEKFQSAIEDAVLKGVKSKLGSYQGTGSSSSVSLSFDFSPVVVIVMAADSRNYFGAIFLRGGNTCVLIESGWHSMSYSLSGGSLSWTGGNTTNLSLNQPGQTYFYVAIGEGGDI